MKKIILLSLIVLQTSTVFSQIASSSYTNKNKIFIYYGRNASAYSQSDIHFRGKDYNFDLKNVVAKDRPSGFAWKYLNPSRITIPQYNFRVGYFFSPKYSISFGFDHMKYVMQQNQTVNISGNISGSGTDYDHAYKNEPIDLTENFLKFEHTNGLNYLNLELRRMDNLFSAKNLPIKNIEINVFEGFGAGILYPKTDVTLLNFDRNDQWHLAGYGTSVVAGLNVTFFKHFFIQAEGKGGFINMPNVLTTNFKDDHAEQHFFFAQANFNLGFIFKL